MNYKLNAKAVVLSHAGEIIPNQEKEWLENEVLHVCAAFFNQNNWAIA